MTRSIILAFVLILAAAVVGVWAFQALPPDARIPVHFRIDGTADGFMRKGPGLAILPAIGAGVVALLVLVGGARRRGDRGLAASSDVLGVALMGVAAMFLVSEAAVVWRAMDPAFDILRPVYLATGVLFVVTGNLLGKVRSNHLIGVRTPWTLRDARVWDKTQRFTGRLLVLGGFALALAAGFIADHRLLIASLILCAAGPGLAGVVYSAVISRPAAQA